MTRPSDRLGFATRRQGFAAICRLIVASGLVLYLWTWWVPKGEQVPLVIVENQSCCLLSFGVVDVDKETVMSMRWSAGYTAWRNGTEIEIRDPWWNVVLRTPGRYRIIPTWPDWAVGEVARCSTCELGGGPR